MANRAIIYRLYPTASQKLYLLKHLDAADLYIIGCCLFNRNGIKMVKSIFQEHMPITFVTGS